MAIDYAFDLSDERKARLRKDAEANGRKVFLELRDLLEGMLNSSTLVVHEALLVRLAYFLFEGIAFEEVGRRHRLVSLYMEIAGAEWSNLNMEVKVLVEGEEATAPAVDKLMELLRNEFPGAPSKKKAWIGYKMCNLVEEHDLPDVQLEELENLWESLCIKYEFEPIGSLRERLFQNFFPVFVREEVKKVKTETAANIPITIRLSKIEEDVVYADEEGKLTMSFLCFLKRSLNTNQRAWKWIGFFIVRTVSEMVANEECGEIVQTYRSLSAKRGFDIKSNLDHALEECAATAI